MRLVYQGTVLDLEQGRIEHGGSHQWLEPQHVRLLRWLSVRRDVWVPLPELVRHVWGMTPGARPDDAQAEVDELAARLEATPDRPRVLRRQPGVGVRLEEPDRVWQPLDAPIWSTPLVGRHDVFEMLERATLGHRLVCVVGAAGQGKSRVAGAWAGRRGAAFVDATACDSPRQVLETLAERLDLAGARALPRRVVAALRARGRIGLVLDGVDALGEELEDLLAQLTEAGPELRWVSTSRRRPAVEGAAFLLLEALAVHDALALLQVRAPATVGDPDGSRALVQRARRSPLAIELLAPWLSSGDASARAAAGDEAYAGVEFAVSQAWSELTTPVQRAAHALRCFRGGFERPAAVAVLESEVLFDELERIGWVVPAADPRRWEVPPALGDWLDDDLGPPMLGARQRHAAWFAHQVRAWCPELDGPAATWVRARVAAERGNLEQAWAWARSARDGTAAWLGLGLARLARSGARPGPEGLRSDEALAGSAELRSRLVLARAHRAHLSGHAEARASLAEQAHRLALAGSDAELEAALEVIRVRLAVAGGEEQALHELEGELRALLRGGDRSPSHRVEALALLGDVHQAQGRAMQAQAAWSQVMGLAAEHGLVERWAWAALQSAELLGQTGAAPRARELLGRVIDVGEATELLPAASRARQRRARLTSGVGERGVARTDLRIAHEHAVAVGDEQQQALVRFEQGALELEEDGRVALPLLEQARAGLSKVGEHEGPVAFLVALATAQAELDRDRRSEARTELEALRGSRWMPGEPFGALWWLVHAVALGLDGQARSAAAAAYEVLERVKTEPGGRLAVGARAVAARLSPEPERLAELLRAPASEPLERDALVGAVRGEPSGAGAWWLVRQVARMRRS